MICGDGDDEPENSRGRRGRSQGSREEEGVFVKERRRIENGTDFFNLIIIIRIIIIKF